MVARMLLRAELRRGLRTHLVVVAMLAGVAAALTLAAVIGRMAQAPWERTWEATGSPHLTVFGRDRATLEELRVDGETASSGPLDSGFVGVHAGRYHVETRLQEIPPAGVGRPAVVEGTDEGLLFERSFARKLGVGPGDRVRFDTRSGPRTERITGLAVVYDQDPYPLAQPGATFGPRALLDALAPEQRFAQEYVRLADPASAPAVAEALQATAGERPETGAVTWLQQRVDAGERYQDIQIALELLSVLLILCAAPIVATLVSERILARGRELAILRAGGLTPGGIVTLNGLFYAVLGALGGLVGLIGGTLVAPVIAQRSEELLGAPETVGPTAAAAIAVVAGTALLAALSAAVPAWLLSRRPATEALAAAQGGGRRRPSRLAHVARWARLPLSAVIGVGDAFARRPRALLASLALAVSIAALVAALGMEQDLRRDRSIEPLQELMTTAFDGGTPFDLITDAGSRAERLRGVVYPGVAALLALGLGNLVAVLALALREGRHDTSILRAVGLTPRDTAWMVVWRQLALSIVAAALGIPIGLGIWWLGSQMGDAQSVTYPSLPLLLAAGAIAVTGCTLVTAPLARMTSRLPVTAVLREE
jgi:ABC-type lipoprotein release transport system permease subunit